MNAKERLERAIAGEPTDIPAVAPAYLSLYLDARIQEHYLAAYRRKLVGQRTCSLDHAEDSQLRAEAILRAYEIFEERPDWMHTEPGESREWAARGEFTLEDGRLTYTDRQTGQKTDMEEPGRLMLPSATRYAYRIRTAKADVWDESAELRTRADVDVWVPVRPVEELDAQGVFEVTRSLARAVGKTTPLCYIAPSPFWSTYSLLGFQGMMIMIRERPDLFRYLMERRHYQRLEMLRGLVAAGLTHVWVEECLSSADLISPRDYEQFAFPTAQQFIRDVKGLGLTVVFYYCGDVVPRLPWLKRLGMDALAVEESKKGFSVDIASVIAGVDGACCVFGNVDAIQVIAEGTRETIQAEVHRQLTLGQQAKGFVLCQGSPFTLDTPPAKIDWFVQSGRQYNPLSSRSYL